MLGRRQLAKKLMTERFEPKLSVLPKAQQEIWPQLAPAPALSLVLYDGTAAALHLGHRISVDFDFFTAAPLDKAKVRAEFAFMKNAKIIQDETNTLVAIAQMPSGSVKVFLATSILADSTIRF